MTSPRRFRIVFVMALVLAAGSAMMAARAFAEGYAWRFHVPVELQNLSPQVKQFDVSVRIYDKDGKEIGACETKQKVGSDGSFSGVVELPFKMSDFIPGKEHKDAATYGADLFLCDDADFCRKADTNGIAWLKSKPGTETVSNTTGPLNP